MTGHRPADLAGSPLVTGATGFAGGHLLDALLEDEPHVFAWGNPRGRAAPSRYAPGRVTWAAVDVTDVHHAARELAAARPSAIFHCAGAADVQSAWADAAHALRVNAMGTHALLTAVERIGLNVPVVVTGSALVYRQSTDALTEDSAIGPGNPYGVSKLAQEMIARRAPVGRIVVARPFNHAGPRQSDAYVTSSFARQIAEAEAGMREPLLRVGNLDARRDITDVRDTVRAYRLLADRGVAGQPYNVCRGEAFRVGDLLDSLVRRSRSRIAVELDPARLRPSDNPVVLGSNERLRADTGWEPRLGIEDTLSDLLEFWRAAIRPAAPER